MFETLDLKKDMALEVEILGNLSSVRTFKLTALVSQLWSQPHRDQIMTTVASLLYWIL